MSRLSVFLCVAGVAASSMVQAQAPVGPSTALDRYELPAVVTFPEGVAYDAPHGVIYAGSAVTGAIVRMNLKTRVSETVVPAGVLWPAGSDAPFPALLGMKIDTKGRLWVAGGRTGKMWILDTKTGQVLKQFEVPNSSVSLINDLAIVGAAGYFTDTRLPILWRIEAKDDQIGGLQGWLDFSHTALQYDSGANLNGIAATPDGRALIVVQMGKGLLFKIDLATKAVVAIDTSGADLSGADGLVLDGHTLYVVRQTAVEIATVQLSARYDKGIVTHRFKDPALAWPATAAKVGTRLLVVNTQFNTRADNTQKLPFTLVSVPLAKLASGR